ncbi:GNAT family N-acetyltransferase [Pelagicoccus mobilis]|uniref:GNAT family N-acetyltransferase n=1 Tax=Pelagicoccus mobilis TaxID=415221 RepID=A0A934RUN8_9BACT|nr:GNAT family protein [Pelagicoccus mobilis]MBK1876761.1 GNAT family N-acetyltransferase [Pelagicoccus mobilis]
MRVYLRKPERADAREFVRASKASVEMHRPWVFPPLSDRGFEDYLNRIQNSRHAGYFVCRKSDDALVGVVNLSEIVRGALQGAFVGYWGVDGMCGKGLMTEGLALAVDEAFEGLGLHRLEINIQPANTRSIALVDRLGFRKEGFSPKYLQINGVWCDHERWAVTKEEWPGAKGIVATLPSNHSSPSK